MALPLEDPKVRLGSYAPTAAPSMGFHESTMRGSYTLCRAVMLAFPRTVCQSLVMHACPDRSTIDTVQSRSSGELSSLNSP
jgi:hypothetical protein